MHAQTGRHYFREVDRDGDKATETVYRTAGCRLRGEGHEVDLLLHEGMDDPTSTRGEMSQKKGVPLTTDAINNSGFGSFGWPVLGGCGGGGSEIGINQE